MVKSETITYNGTKYTRTYSDGNKYIKRNDTLYIEAIDPIGTQRDYTESDIEISENSKYDQLTEIIAVAEMVDNLGGFSEKVVQSDKLGFDWIETYLGEKLIKQEYVAQDNPVGTMDNPITYYEGVALINNAFYVKDGVRQAYMNGMWAEF